MSTLIYDPSSAAVSYEASGGKPFIKDGYLFADGLNRRQKRAIKAGTHYEELGVKVDREDAVLEVGELDDVMLGLLQQAKEKARTHTSVGKVKGAPQEGEGEERPSPAKQKQAAFKTMHQVRQAEEDFIVSQLQKKEKVVVSEAAEALITPFGRDAHVERPVERFSGLLDNTAAAAWLVAGEGDTTGGDEEAVIRGKAQEELRDIHANWKTASTGQKQYYNKWFKLVFAEGKPVKKPTPEPDLEAAKRILMDLASNWPSLSQSQKDYYHEWYPKVFPESPSPSPTPTPTPVPLAPAADLMPQGRKVLRQYFKRWSDLSRDQRVFYNTHFYRYFPNRKQQSTL
eukprot:TRINITY_DN19623_c0_g1_i2.p1 TRINITY_DN19623_c0_g1~~TRINITY_DN19623_c0_g1_i2.p1  ORF type:complete len:353 (+),score=105.27 TRINITY_DN19623_c0_g1_i2:34-1059(+)